MIFIQNEDTLGITITWPIVAALDWKPAVLIWVRPRRSQSILWRRIRLWSDLTMIMKLQHNLKREHSKSWVFFNLGSLCFVQEESEVLGFFNFLSLCFAQEHLKICMCLLAWFFCRNPIISEVERQQEQKFEIDLMVRNGDRDRTQNFLCLILSVSFFEDFI